MVVEISKFHPNFFPQLVSPIFELNLAAASSISLPSSLIFPKLKTSPISISPLSFILSLQLQTRPLLQAIARLLSGVVSPFFLYLYFFCSAEGSSRFPYFAAIRLRSSPDSSFFASGNIERELLAKQVGLDLSEEDKQQLTNLETRSKSITLLLLDTKSYCGRIELIRSSSSYA